jgi:exosortase
VLGKSDFNRSALLDSWYARLAGWFLCLGVIGAFVYADTLAELFTTVLRREESSHGLFVPLLSLYFVWRKRSNLRKIEPRGEIFPGLGSVAGGLVLFSLVNPHGYFFWECVSFLVVLTGLVVCFLGKDTLKEIFFPIFFLGLMVPIPWTLYQTIADGVREAAMEVSTVVLGLTGVTFLRDGLFIHLPNATLNVDIGCSGIRYLLSYFVFGIAYAYLYRTRVRQRVLVVCLTVPISLLASTLRLTSITLLTYHIGPQMAEHWPHVITSWLVFFSVLACFVGLDWWLLSKSEKQELHSGRGELGKGVQSEVGRCL